MDRSDTAMSDIEPNKIKLEPSARVEVRRGHSLASASAKYNRAVEHYDSFRMAAMAFEAQASTAATFDQRRVSRLQIDFFAKLPRPPLTLSCQLGDLVHNLRTTLDHVAWALAVDHSFNGKRTKVHFPLKDSAEAFQKGRPRFEYLFGAQATCLVAQLQPYADLPGLSWVSALDNADKHEALVLMLHHLTVRSIEIVNKLTGEPFLSSSQSEVAFPVSGDGLIFHLVADKPIPADQLRIAVKLRNTLSFEKHNSRAWKQDPLNETLQKMFEDVKFCLNAARAFLDGPGGCQGDPDCIETYEQTEQDDGARDQDDDT